MAFPPIAIGPMGLFERALFEEPSPFRTMARFPPHLRTPLAASFSWRDYVIPLTGGAA